MKYISSTLFVCQLFACQTATGAGWKTIGFGPKLTKMEVNHILGAVR